MPFNMLYRDRRGSARARLAISRMRVSVSIYITNSRAGTTSRRSLTRSACQTGGGSFAARSGGGSPGSAAAAAGAAAAAESAVDPANPAAESAAAAEAEAPEAAADVPPAPLEPVQVSVEAEPRAEAAGDPAAGPVDHPAEATGVAAAAGSSGLESPRILARTSPNFSTPCRGSAGSTKAGTPEGGRGPPQKPRAP
eukprot:5794627-Alexandrium_andersonii.AAC.1